MNASRDWASRPRFADCAIDFCTGRRNGITVLDIDSQDDSVLAEALERHGNTPILVRTASGKAHAWYRYNGEGRCIRPWGDRLPIDVLGDRDGMNNGLVIAPRSRRPDGTEYHFLRGDLADLGKLPTMRGVEDLKRELRERGKPEP